MRVSIATLCVAALLAVLAIPASGAAPTAVNVRVEGPSETLFEGPILAEPHGVRASSDPIAPKLRRCDGINESSPAGAAPALTPTAVSADAMTLIGETFDAKWYDGFEDYFLTRWGPAAQDAGAGAFWGVLVNDVFAPVGGCQYGLDAGDEVLWIYDAFKGRPTLALFPAVPHYSSGPRPLTAIAMLNQPFPVEVVSYADQENSPPAAPTRLGSAGFSGARVSPVLTGPNGFEQIDTASGASVTTDSAGKAAIEFTVPGWHRIKATMGSAGIESAIRSNRLDVCVAAAGESDCGPPPDEDLPRIPPPTIGEIEGPRRKPAAAQSGTGQGGADPAPATAAAGRVHITVPRLDRRRIGRGRVGVSWRVLSPGPGIAGWTIASRTLGRRGAPFVTRAAGAGGTSSTLRLPRGNSYRLRFTITDVLGRVSSAELGKVTVPGERRD
jgi:hypothetical protein